MFSKLQLASEGKEALESYTECLSIQLQLKSKETSASGQATQDAVTAKQLLQTNLSPQKKKSFKDFVKAKAKLDRDPESSQK